MRPRSCIQETSTVKGRGFLLCVEASFFERQAFLVYPDDGMFNERDKGQSEENERIMRDFGCFL